MRRDLLNSLKREESRAFSGWDFSHLDGRMFEEEPLWSYGTEIAGFIATSTSMLDMGTGGGEFLASLDGLPPETHATEGYAPNIPVARKTLDPLGVEVHEIGEDDFLPFADGSFDLIINRHESYDPAEVFRVLRSGGRFVTQQVGGENDTDLNALLRSPESDFGMSYWNLEYAREQLLDEGFQVIEAREEFPVTQFMDTGAVVYYLKAVPWQIPDFSVKRYASRLEVLDEEIQQNGSLKVRSHRFLLISSRETGPATLQASQDR